MHRGRCATGARAAPVCSWDEPSGAMSPVAVACKVSAPDLQTGGAVARRSRSDALTTEGESRSRFPPLLDFVSRHRIETGDVELFPLEVARFQLGIAVIPKAHFLTICRCAESTKHATHTKDRLDSKAKHRVRAA